MATTSLKDYLEIVVDMEKNIFLQNQAISRLQGEIDELGKPNSYDKPLEPVKPEETNQGEILLGLLLPIIFGILGVLAVKWGAGFWGTPSFMMAVIVVAFGVMFVLVAIIITLFTEIPGAIGEIRRGKMAQIHYEEELKKYKQELKEYDDKLRSDKDRVEKELVRKSVLTTNLSVLFSQREKSSTNLSKIYSRNIIYHKYRYFSAVCSFYEYLCSGRCYTLDGTDGAYNMFEKEISINRIIKSLDLILANLQAIRQNQYVLYSAVQDTSRRVRAIVDNTNQMARQIEQISVQQRLSDEELKRQISRLQKSSELNAYQSERIQKELSYMNRMNYYAGRNDGSFYNLPPT